MGNSGITLKSGRQVSGSTLNSLTPEEVKELAETAATKWDILLLREMNHSNRDEMQKILNAVSEIKEELIVETGNGKRIKQKIKVVLGELYDQHQPDRRRKRFMQSVKEYRIHLVILGSAILFFSVAFQEYLSTLLILARENVEQAIGLGLIPVILVGIIKWVIKRKTR